MSSGTFDGEEAIRADEMRKSRLILEAKLFRDRGEHDAAASRLAEAAILEDRLSEAYEKIGSAESSAVSQFSAASLWAQAGNFYRSLVLCDQLLAQAGLPQKLRERVTSFGATLRTRRNRWFNELASQSFSS